VKRLLPGKTGWCGQVDAATMAAIKRRDLANLPARQTDRHGDGLPGMAAAGRAGQALVLNLAERRLKQTTAQATSTNANHRCLIALVSLAATLLLYDLGVRRSALTRFLFGLKQPGGPAARTAHQVDDSDAPPSRRLAPSERDEQEPTLTKGAWS
jgi:hypothetical protein